MKLNLKGLLLPFPMTIITCMLLVIGLWVSVEMNNDLDNTGNEYKVKGVKIVEAYPSEKVDQTIEVVFQDSKKRYTLYVHEDAIDRLKKDVTYDITYLMNSDFHPHDFVLRDAVPQKKEK